MCLSGNCSLCKTNSWPTKNTGRLPNPKNYAEALHPFTVERSQMVGSRWVCNPPVLDTDTDILILLKDVEYEDQSIMEARHEQMDLERDSYKPHNLSLASFVLRKAGWTCTEDYDQEKREGAPFLTARKDEFNLIIYTDPVGYGRFLGASCVCKMLNLTVKEDRVRVLRSATEDDYFHD